MKKQRRFLSRVQLALLCLAIGAFSLGCEDDEDETAPEDVPAAEADSASQDAPERRDEPAAPPNAATNILNSLIGAYKTVTNVTFGGTNYLVGEERGGSGGGDVDLLTVVDPYDVIMVWVDISIGNYPAGPYYTISELGPTSWDLTTRTLTGSLYVWMDGRVPERTEEPYTIEFSGASNAMLRIPGISVDLALPISR